MSFMTSEPHVTTPGYVSHRDSSTAHDDSLEVIPLPSSGDAHDVVNMSLDSIATMTSPSAAAAAAVDGGPSVYGSASAHAATDDRLMDEVTHSPLLHEMSGWIEHDDDSTAAVSAVAFDVSASVVGVPAEGQGAPEWH